MPEVQGVGDQSDEDDWPEAQESPDKRGARRPGVNHQRRSQTGRQGGATGKRCQLGNEQNTPSHEGHSEHGGDVRIDGPRSGGTTPSASSAPINNSQPRVGAR